jgi:hypothetical protein
VRLELLPLLLGILVGLVGLALVADGWLPDAVADGGVERRRRPRSDRHRGGEVLVGLGVLAVAAALVGGGGWRWGNVAVLAGVALMTAGAVLNRRFLREALTFRGAARRGRSADRPTTPPETPGPR